MNQENKKLGRGLASLFSSSDNNFAKDNLKHLNITSKMPNKEQPRKKNDS